MQIQIDNASDRPVYQQIVDQVKRDIALGKLVKDDRLPTVRDLAAQLVINPNTIAKAFRQLEQEGVIVSHVYIERIRKVPRPTSFDAEYGYLTNMYTLPAFRGQEIGANLLRVAVEWAREQHLEMIILWPARGREAFYERSGFIAEPKAMSLELEEG